MEGITIWKRNSNLVSSLGTITRWVKEKRAASAYGYLNTVWYISNKYDSVPNPQNTSNANVARAYMPPSKSMPWRSVYRMCTDHTNMIICTQYVYINGKVVVKNRARKVMHSKYHNKKMVTFSTLYSLYIRMKNHQSVTKSKSSDTEFNHIDSNLFLYFWRSSNFSVGFVKGLQWSIWHLKVPCLIACNVQPTTIVLLNWLDEWCILLIGQGSSIYMTYDIVRWYWTITNKYRSNENRQVEDGVEEVEAHSRAIKLVVSQVSSKIAVVLVQG